MMVVTQIHSVCWKLKYFPWIISFLIIRELNKSFQMICGIFSKMSLTPSTTSESNHGRKQIRRGTSWVRARRKKQQARKNTIQCGVWFGSSPYCAIKSSQLCVHAWAHMVEWGAMRQLVGVQTHCCC